MIGILIFIALLTLIVCDFVLKIIYIYQQNIVPTHIKGNILDLILTSSEDLVDNVCVISQPHDFLSSDHFLIYFCICSSYFSSSTYKTPSYFFRPL